MRIILKISGILVLAPILIGLNCIQYGYNFRPSSPSPYIRWPARVCLDWSAATDQVLYFERPKTSQIPIFADSPIGWAANSDSLLLEYNGEIFSLPPKDSSGFLPRITDRFLLYVGEDEHSVIAYNFASTDIQCYSVNKRIFTLIGTNPFFALGRDEEDENYIAYIIDPVEGVSELGDIPGQTLLYETINVQVLAEAMYLVAGTRLFRCDIGGISCIFDFNGLVTLNNSPYDTIRIKGGVCGKDTQLLISGQNTYYILKIHEDSAEITDIISDYFQHNALPLFTYYNGGWVTCVDGQIQRRNSNMSAFQTVAVLPDNINSYSTTEPYEMFPDSLIFYIFDGCNGELVLVTDKGLVLYNEYSDSFREYQLIEDGTEKITSVSSNDLGLILGTDSSYIIMLKQE